MKLDEAFETPVLRNVKTRFSGRTHGEFLLCRERGTRPTRVVGRMRISTRKGEMPTICNGSRDSLKAEQGEEYAKPQNDG